MKVTFDSTSSYRSTAGILVPLMILAATIRGLIAYNGPLWRDELLFIAIVRAGSFRDMLRVLHFHESHPPLFYALMRAWGSLAGDTDSRFLLFMIALGVLLVPLMFVAGSILHSRRTGVVAAVLTAVSPALSEFSAEVRPYSLLPILVLLSCATLALGLERKSRWVWAGYVTSTIPLVYTHNWALLVVAGQVVATLVVLWRGERGTRRRAFVEPGSAFLAVGAAYLPWIPTLIYQVAHAGHPPSGRPGLSAFSLLVLGGATTAVQSTLLPTVHAERVLALVAGVALAVLFLVVVFRGAVGRMPRIPVFRSETNNFDAEARSSLSLLANTVFLIVAAVATNAAAVLSIRSDMLQPRCFSILTPLVILVVADALNRASGNSRPFRSGVAVALAAFLILDYGVRLDFLITSPRSNSQPVAASVELATRPSDLIIVVPDWIAPSFNHYYHASVDQIDFPSPGRLESIEFVDVWNRFADPRAIQRVEGAIEAAKRDKRRVWLIVDRHSLKPLSAEDEARAATPGEYALMSRVRAIQIQQKLTAEFGYATRIEPTGSRPPRYEELLAFLFSPL